MKQLYKSFGVAVLLIVGVLGAAPALAHKASVFAWVEGETIQTQSKFSGGRFVKDGLIEVYDPAGNKLLEGRTDDQGRFGFAIPQRSDLKIVLTAGSGHGNSWIVRATELGAAQSAEAPPPPAPLPATPLPAAEQVTGLYLDPTTLETLIRTSIEQELAPLRAQIAEQAWGLRDILSGIGYIIGLMGLASYLHYRKLVRAIERPGS
jgi:nickel transport protein